MVDLSALIQAAHGGDAVNSLAAQFGLSPEQANAAIEALAPALAHGLQNQAQDPDGFGQIVGHLTDSTHQDAFADPAAAQAPEAANAGGDLLNQIFGGSDGINRIAQHIGQQTGIDPQILSQLMPVVASMATGGIAKTMQDNGLGGLLSQLSGAGGQQGGLGGLIGGILGSLFGRGAPAAGSGEAPAAGSAPATGGLDPALVQAGMNALSGLFQPGSTSSGLQNVLGQILAKR